MTQPVITVRGQRGKGPSGRKAKRRKASLAQALTQAAKPERAERSGGR